MHHIFGGHRYKYCFPVRNMIDYGRMANFLRMLEQNEYEKSDTFVLCENRPQVTLGILRRIAAKNALPRKIIVVTGKNDNGWLQRRMPERLHKLVEITSDPNDVK